MARPKLLFVDDEASIRLTLPAILEMHGFEVTSCASVSEALSHIQKDKFEVLLSDLNIGEAGDGFTVVSAMRRTQPEAVTIILTGYPAFETALQAIRKQVDDYVVKPSNPEQLIETIQSHLDHRGTHHAPPLRRVSYVLEESLDAMEMEFVQELRSNAVFPVESLSDKQVANHVRDVLAHLVASLRKSQQEPSHDNTGAVKHARQRCDQGFTLSMLVEESCILRSIIFRKVQANLLGVDLSSLVPDLIRTGAELDYNLKVGTETFLKKCPSGVVSGDRERTA